MMYVRVCHACGLRNLDCHMCIRMALAVGARSRSLGGLGRRRVELKVWRRAERGLQVVEEESVRGYAAVYQA